MYISNNPTRDQHRKAAEHLCRVTGESCSLGIIKRILGVDTFAVASLRSQGMPYLRDAGSTHYRYSPQAVLDWMRESGDFNFPALKYLLDPEEQEKLFWAIANLPPIPDAENPGTASACTQNAESARSKISAEERRENATQSIAALYAVLPETVRDHLVKAMLDAAYPEGWADACQDPLIRSAIARGGAEEHTCIQLIHTGTKTELCNWLQGKMSADLWLRLLSLEFQNLQRSPVFSTYQIAARIPCTAGAVWIAINAPAALLREWALRENKQEMLVCFSDEELCTETQQCFEQVRYFVEEYAEIRERAAREAPGHAGVSTGGLPTVKVAVAEYVRRHPKDPEKGVFVRSFVNKQHVAHPEKYVPDADGISEPLAPTPRKC